VHHLITMTFIRFSVPSDEVRIEPHVAAGLFHATYRLARAGRLAAGERLWFEAEMEWFDKHLPATRALPTWRAICWFRGDAGRSHLPHLAHRRHRRRRRHPGPRLSLAPPGPDRLRRPVPDRRHPVARFVHGETQRSPNK
jgi:hypothetical protein